MLAAGRPRGLPACRRAAAPDAAGAGDVVPGRASVEVIGDFGFVLIPTGRLDLVLGEPTTDDVGARPGGATTRPTRRRTGGSWVPVHVEHDPFGEGGVPVGLIGGAPQPAELALVVDGTTVDLGAPYRVVGEKGTADSGLDTVWVAVDEAPDEIGSMKLAVTYDGLTQTLDPATGEREAGAAAALYDEPVAGAEAACAADGFDREGVQLDLACQVRACRSARRTCPAPAGPPRGARGWSSAPSISVDSVVVGGTSYDVESIEPHVTRQRCRAAAARRAARPGRPRARPGSPAPGPSRRPPTGPTS